MDNKENKNSRLSPTIMLAIGIIFLIPSIYNLIKNFHLYSLTVDLMPLIIGGILFAGGIIRLSKK
ncbi:hypothetical protein [Candidatus Clostridium stratigraminis]|uniref:DUF5668 domain-containing protein n=1 Tax=Candidatus Clostridium stratigraminis TaxID=3381661 RepID=A0ABW8T8Y0_9CLOT